MSENCKINNSGELDLSEGHESPDNTIRIANYNFNMPFNMPCILVSGNMPTGKYKNNGYDCTINKTQVQKPEIDTIKYKFHSKIPLIGWFIDICRNKDYTESEEAFNDRIKTNNLKPRLTRNIYNDRQYDGDGNMIRQGTLVQTDEYYMSDEDYEKYKDLDTQIKQEKQTLEGIKVEIIRQWVIRQWVIRGQLKSKNEIDNDSEIRKRIENEINWIIEQLKSKNEVESKLDSEIYKIKNEIDNDPEIYKQKTKINVNLQSKQNDILHSSRVIVKQTIYNNITEKKRAQNKEKKEIKELLAKEYKTNRCNLDLAVNDLKAIQKIIAKRDEDLNLNETQRTTPLLSTTKYEMLKLLEEKINKTIRLLKEEYKELRRLTMQSMRQTQAAKKKLEELKNNYEEKRKQLNKTYEEKYAEMFSQQALKSDVPSKQNSIRKTFQRSYN